MRPAWMDEPEIVREQEREEFEALFLEWEYADRWEATDE